MTEDEVSAVHRGLHDRIAHRAARLAVVGMGYVGTPVACRFAEVGFAVLGVDIDEGRVSALNAGDMPFEGAEPGLAELLEDVVGRGALRVTSDYNALQGVDVVLVAVETPVDDTNLPRYEALKSALSSIGPQLWPGSLVVIESTLAPGTMDEFVTPALAASSGLAVDLGHLINGLLTDLGAGDLTKVENLGETRFDRCVRDQIPVVRQ